MSKWGVFDEKYLRPFFIYKYEKMKNRPQFEMEDVLAEYMAIEEELNDSSGDELLESDGNYDQSFSQLQK